MHRSLIAIVRKHLKEFVHPAARACKLERARHETFIFAQLATIALAGLFIPHCLGAAGADAIWRIAALVWFIAPAAAIAHLARSGDLVGAQLISLASLVGLALIVTIGARLSLEASLGWLMLTPLEAALFGSTAMLRLASLLTLTIALALVGLESAGWIGPFKPFDAAAAAALAVPVGAYAALLLLGGRRLRRAQRQLEVSHAKHYQALSDAIGDLVLRHDAAGGVISAIGDSAALFGLPQEALIGRGLLNRIHVADRPAYLHTIDTAAQRDGAMTATVRLRSGESRHSAAGYEEPVFAWAEIRVHRFGPSHATSDGAAAISVVRNVTDAKTTEQRLEAARAEAELANAWKDRLLANVSHELRTPLNAIIGFSEMLRDPQFRPRDAAKEVEYAGIIHASAEHLLAMVNVLLDTSKIAAGKFRIAPEPFDIERLIADCCDMLRLRAEAGEVELVRAPMDGRRDLVADKQACRQILINLLSNAVKFTEVGGRVIVGADVVGDSMHLHVTDTGVGIPAEFLPRLGDPFFQVRADYDRIFEGAGLGLSLVRGLVGLHGGALSLESVAGVGTRVTARLPLICRPEDRPGRSAVAILETASHFGHRGAPRASEFAAQEKKIA
ncbi:MAG: PAS domain-containing sensor histidine kinase [Hyphomicrobiales bacterium]|nr:PAS domain-containing sensor histidine kinase [Hyphomicrobiales bacterium]